MSETQHIENQMKENEKDYSAEQARRQLEAVKAEYAKQREKETFFEVLMRAIGWFIGGIVLAWLFYLICFKTSVFIALKILAGVLFVPFILSFFYAGISMIKWLFD